MTVRIWDLHEQAHASSSSSSCVLVGTGHTDAVGTVAISQHTASYANKQAFAVSAAGDKIIKKWSFLLTPKGPAAGAGAAAGSKGGAAEARASSRSMTSALSIRAHDKDINSVAIAPNDSIIASGSQDKTIRLWRSEDLAAVTTLVGHKRGVWKVIFSPVDRVLCSSSADKTLRLWSMADYSCLRTFEGHTASVLCCRFISQGMQILSGSADGLVRLWDLRSGGCLNTFDQHEDKIWAISVPRHLGASRDEDREELTLDGASGRGAAGLDLNELDASTAAAASRGSPPLQLFYSGGSDARILTWVDSTKEEENKKLEENEKYLLQEQQMMNDIRNKHFGKVRVCGC